MMDTAARWLRSAKRVAVLTGAGISAESGVPTFRGAGGLWRNFRAEELATPQAFARDPKLVWEWYNWRRELIAAVEPNAGHGALVKLEASIESFTLVTQNVDGLHDRAGSKRPLKLHGDIWRMRCTSCGREWDDRTVPLVQIPPVCPDCGKLARPAIVWFGENLPQQVWREAERVVAHAEVLLVVGTSAVVYPAASLAPLAKDAGAKVVVVNIEETAVDSVADITLLGPSGEVLPELVRRMKAIPLPAIGT